MTSCCTLTVTFCKYKLLLGIPDEGRQRAEEERQLAREKTRSGHTNKNEQWQEEEEPGGSNQKNDDGDGGDDDKTEHVELEEEEHHAKMGNYWIDATVVVLRAKWVALEAANAQKIHSH